MCRVAQFLLIFISLSSFCHAESKEAVTLGEHPKDILSAEVSGIKVSELSLVVNSIERTHFKQTFSEYISTLRKLKIKAGTLYAVGAYPDEFMLAPSPESLEFIQKKGRFIPVTKAPKEYKVTLSPTWLVKTSQGVVVLEGIEDPKVLLNAKGEYIPNSNSTKYHLLNR